VPYPFIGTYKHINVLLFFFEPKYNVEFLISVFICSCVCRYIYFFLKGLTVIYTVRTSIFFPITISPKTLIIFPVHSFAAGRYTPRLPI
jgi:hypothetical protein